ncbi:bis(5'-nucleosyl)-tetraphosphatase (symmetrical) YqeK [Paucilactobacillus kaifaensis]|uniref:bis(5'-nucleosyl)-tetraphosphatase (symmetrical) YqeK n=1 Tax=Paucilactobacillus kaifaensis TaxID=2559921 RepID=UPI0010F6DB3A|nr:bis(5'-nucleosyl)-tetraphosphatase (symmetrical) YqeK [Paucilactobacillus kaifaensis]
MSKELIYQQHFLPSSRAELVDVLQHTLTKTRFEHVLRVEQTALQLALQNDVSLEKASIAGLTHDYAKQRPNQDFIKVIQENKMDPDLLNYGNAIWHGVVGAELVKQELHVWDEDILNAIRHHTTGAQVMSKLEQVIYMADYIEPGRDFPGVVEARQITQASLSAGVAYQTKQTLQYLIEHDKAVYPKTIATYNAWVATNGGN